MTGDNDLLNCEHYNGQRNDPVNWTVYHRCENDLPNYDHRVMQDFVSVRDMGLVQIMQKGGDSVVN